jgi:hypothetical protein
LHRNKTRPPQLTTAVPRYLSAKLHRFPLACSSTLERQFIGHKLALETEYPGNQTFHDGRATNEHFTRIANRYFHVIVVHDAKLDVEDSSSTGCGLGKVRCCRVQRCDAVGFRHAKTLRPQLVLSANRRVPEATAKHNGTWPGDAFLNVFGTSPTIRGGVGAPPPLTNCKLLVSYCIQTAKRVEHSKNTENIGFAHFANVWMVDHFPRHGWYTSKMCNTMFFHRAQSFHWVPFVPATKPRRVRNQKRTTAERRTHMMTILRPK